MLLHLSLAACGFWGIDRSILVQPKPTHAQGDGYRGDQNTPELLEVTFQGIKRYKETTLYHKITHDLYVNGILSDKRSRTP